MKINKSDIRDIFFENIKKQFIKNKNFYLITNDVDLFSLKSIKKNKRFLDIGVAEQNMINISAGIASNKKKNVLVYGFCTFLSFRCYEQIKFNIASHNLNCKLVGIGPGFSFPNDGPTHHGIQDLYLMYLIPEFEIINISDNNLANHISKNLSNISGPVYVRIDKGKCDFNSDILYNFKKGFEYTIKKRNSKKLVITTGYINKIANNVALENNCDVINIFRFKKFDEKKFVNNIKIYSKITIFDENTYSGGITPIIQKIIIKYKLDIKINFLTLPDEQIFVYSNTREQMLKKFGLTEKNLKIKIS